MTFVRVAAFTLGILLLIVGLQNSEAVTVQFLFWTASLSLVILLAIATMLGLAAGLIIGEVRRRRGRVVADG